LKLKPIAIAAALTTFGAASVYAQTAPQTPPAAPAPTMQNQAKMDIGVSADTRKLIGRNIQNQNNETIGEIEAIFLDSAGKVAGVVVGVGGFLGINQREVLISWKDLNIINNGEKVTVNMTKDQLKAMPEYKYKDPTYRGQIFTDTGVYRDGTRADTRPIDTRTPPATAERRAATERTPANRPATGIGHDFNADGHLSVEALTGASVRNANNEKVGEIVDAYVDEKGQIHTVVVSVGGFLGVGSKDVAVKWSDIKQSRDGKSVVLTTSFSKDELKSMPDYKYERRVPSQAAAPNGTPRTR